MKHVKYLLLLVLLVPTVAWGSLLGLHKSTEKVAFKVLEPLEATGTQQKPDSCHVTAFANGDEVYDTMNTTWPFTACGIDTFVQYGDTLYWFSRDIQEFDGAGGNHTLALSIVMYTGGLPTETAREIQIITDSLNTSLKNISDSDTLEFIAADVITATSIATDAIGGAEIASGAIGSTEIGTGAIDADAIAADAIGASEVASGAVVFGTEATGFFNYTTNRTFTSVTALDGDTLSLEDLKDFADAGYNPATDKITGKVTVESLDADVVDASAIAATGAVEIAWANWDLTTDGHTGAGTFGLMLESCSTGVAGIKAQTDLLTFDGNDSLIVGAAHFSVPQSGWSTYNPASDSVIVDVSAAATANGLVDEIQSGLSTFDNTADSVIADVSAAATANGLVDEIQSGLSTFNNTSDSVIVDVSSAASANGLLPHVWLVTTRALTDKAGFALSDISYSVIADSVWFADSVAHSDSLGAAKMGYLLLEILEGSSFNPATDYVMVDSLVDSLLRYRKYDVSSMDSFFQVFFVTAPNLNDSIWAVNPSTITMPAGDTAILSRLWDVYIYAVEVDDSLGSQTWAATSASDLDSAVASRIVGRKIWGQAVGGAGSTDSVAVTARYVGAITGMDANAIGSGDIATGAITASVVADGTIDSATFAASSITQYAMAPNVIGSSEIDASAIGATEIAANAITSSEIADGAIDAGAIATDAITATKIAAGAIVNGTEATGFATHAQVDSLKDTVEDMSTRTAILPDSIPAGIHAILDSLANQVWASVYSMPDSIPAGIWTILDSLANQIWASTGGTATIPDSIAQGIHDILDSLANQSWAAVGGTGTGPDPLLVYVLNTVDSSAIVAATVSADTKWDGNGTEYADGTTGAGLASFGLNDGDSILVMGIVAGYSMSVDSLIMAAGTNVCTLWATAPVVSAPVSASLTAVYADLFTGNGDTLSNARVHIELYGAGSAIDTSINVRITPGVIDTVTNSSGRFTVNLYRNANLLTKANSPAPWWRATISHSSLTIPSHIYFFIDASDTTYNLNDIINNKVQESPPY